MSTISFALAVLALKHLKLVCLQVLNRFILIHMLRSYKCYVFIFNFASVHIGHSLIIILKYNATLFFSVPGTFFKTTYLVISVIESLSFN